MKKTIHLGAAVLMGTALAGCPATAPVTPGFTPAPTVTTTQVGDRFLGIAAAGGQLYCGCANYVDLFDTATNLRGKRVEVEGGTPGPVRTFIDRREVLVQDEARGELRVLDAAATAPTPQTVGVTLQTLPVGKGTGRLSLGDDNQTVASSAGQDRKVVSFFFTDDRGKAPARTEWEVGAPAADGQARPLDWKNSKLLTVDFSTNALKLFDGANLTGKTLTTLQTVGPVGLGTDVGKAVITKGASEGVATVAIAIDKGKDALVLVDLATGKVSTLTGLGKGARQLLVDPDNGRAFVGMYDSDEVAVVDYRTQTVITRVPVAHHPMNLSVAPPTEGEIWVGGEDGALTVLDAKTNNVTVRNTLAIGKGDHHMTFWGTKGYVSNQADGTLNTIERVNFRVPH
ncbi:MAG: cell surface protein [Cyanobacteria bacterium RYN_339]|nr:cell surface protein [Cyanobacteria bacterium RYN_339]